MAASLCLREPEARRSACSPMREYRAFVLSTQGTVIAMHYLHCEDQERAIEQAKQLSDTNAVELWDPPVRVARFEPKK